MLDITNSHLLRAVVPRPLLGALAGVEQGAVVTGRHALAVVGAQVGVLKSKPNDKNALEQKMFKSYLLAWVLPLAVCAAVGILAAAVVGTHEVCAEAMDAWAQGGTFVDVVLADLWIKRCEIVTFEKVLHVYLSLVSSAVAVTVESVYEVLAGPSVLAGHGGALVNVGQAVDAGVAGGAQALVVLQEKYGIQIHLEEDGERKRAKQKREKTRRRRRGKTRERERARKREKEKEFERV